MRDNSSGSDEFYKPSSEENDIYTDSDSSEFAGFQSSKRVKPKMNDKIKRFYWTSADDEAMRFQTWHEVMRDLDEELVYESDEIGE